VYVAVFKDIEYRSQYVQKMPLLLHWQDMITK